MRSNCRFCGDREGGCVACYGEIEKAERVRAGEIAGWQPPNQAVIDALGRREIPRDDLTGEQRYMAGALQRMVDRMSDEELAHMLVKAQTPPVLFAASPDNPHDMEIMDRLYSVQVASSDTTQKSRLSVVERGILARAYQAMKKQSFVYTGVFIPTRGADAAKTSN